MKRDSCSPNSYLNDVIYGSETICETRVALTCVTSLGAKDTGQTTTNIEACVAQYGTYACTDYFDDNPSGHCVPPAGTLATGAACGAAAQCASQFCQIGPYSICGTCQPLPAAGAVCQDAAQCGRNMDCVKPAGSTALDMGVCAAYSALMGACLTDVVPCEAGLSCVGDVAATMTMGMCQTAGTMVGATCDRAHKTAPGCNADMGLVCIPAGAGMSTGTCQAITLAAANAPCGNIGAMPITGYASCEAGGLCVVATAGAAMGTCMAPAMDGAACNPDPTVGPGCLAPAKCIPTSDAGTAGTCVVPNAQTCM
jgi:hypothetical protein